ncbi:MAG: hypothetical protein D6798_08860, partial [Deltaproteobacteria bacterium]
MTAAADEGRLRVLGVVEGDDAGPVFLARWMRPGKADREVVVQLLDPGSLPADAVADRLADELPRLARLEEHGALVIERLLSVEGHRTLLRRHVPAVDLATVLSAEELAPGLALTIGARVARTLTAAHGLPGTGAMAHGALGLDKVLVTAEGEVWVTGLGVARARFAVEGAPPAADPEQVDPHAPPEGRSAGPTPAGDVHALGALVLAALDGALRGPPATSPSAHRARLDAALHPLARRLSGELSLLPDLLAVLMSYDPGQRPTAADCADALAALAEHAVGPSLADWAAEALPPLVASVGSAARRRAVEGEVFGLELPVGPPPGPAPQH